MAHVSQHDTGISQQFGDRTVVTVSNGNPDVGSIKG